MHKLLNSLKTRAHIIYNDASLNDAETVAVNLYQTFLVSAMKLYTYLKVTSSARLSFQASYIVDAIRSAVAFSPKVVLARAQRGKRLHPDVLCRLDPTRVRFLGLDAFIRIFSRKKSAHLQPIVLALDRERNNVYPGRRCSRQRRHAQTLAAEAWRVSSNVIESIQY